MNVERKPVVSVIVPVYNVERYLQDCIDGILKQTFCDYELILVDDGSTDGCPAVCDAYAVQDNRVRVLHKANGGLSSARNAGMDAARADLFSFIDSDDLVHPQMLETLVGPLLDDNAVDISMCAFERCCNSDDCDMRHRELPELRVVDSVSALENIYGNIVPNIGFVAWNKVYRRSVFEQSGVLYPEGKLYEDAFTTYRLLYEANKVAVVDERLYFYRVRPGSIMSEGKKVDERRIDELEADTGAWEFFRNKEKTLAVASTKTLLRTCIGIWRDADEEGSALVAKKHAMDVYRTAWKMSSGLLNTEFKKKAAYGLFLVAPRIACHLISAFGR